MFENTEKLVLQGMKNREYPCAAIAIGRGDEVYLRKIYALSDPDGNETEINDISQELMLFDMASLTKVIAPTMIALRMIEDGKLCLFDQISRFFKDCGEFSDVSVIDLMTHRSGITPHIGLYNVCSEPGEAVKTILSSKPVCKNGEQVHYSCMGYILLGKLLEQLSGRTLSDLAAEYVFTPLGMSTAGYNPTERFALSECAPTELRTDNTHVHGEVHDENANYLDGISGNAGVFASIDDMIRFASMLSHRGSFEGKDYLTSRTFELAVKNHTRGKAESRGLGLQLMHDNYSPMGALMSEGSYGHTGFTGTSLYVDNDTGVYGILLTNAVYYGRERMKYFHTRRCFYNLMMNEYLRNR